MPSLTQHRSQSRSDSIPGAVPLPPGNPQRCITLPHSSSSRGKFDEMDQVLPGQAPEQLGSIQEAPGIRRASVIERASSLGGVLTRALSSKGVKQAARRAFTNQGSAGSRPMERHLAGLLGDVVEPPRRKSCRLSRDTDGTGEPQDEEEALQEHLDCYPEANYTIFTKEGEPSPGLPMIGFLSPFAVWWDRLRVLVALWTLAYTPVALAFRGRYEDVVGHPVAITVELLFDVLFLVGVLLGFVTTVGSASAGREYVSPPLVWRRRLCSAGFWCDALSCVPLAAGAASGELLLPASETLRRLHLLKLLRINWVLYIPASHFETRFWSLMPLIRMLVWIVISMHLTACLWYDLVLREGTVDLHLEDMGDKATESSHYLMALRQGVYLVTGKPTDSFSDSELVLIGVTGALGGIFFAFIYGNTTMLLTRMNIHMTKHHKHMALIQRTMNTLGLPVNLQQRIRQYHHFLAVHHNINAYSLLMQGLSVSLFIELKAHLFKQMFSQGPFFTGAPTSFLRNLLQVMVEVTFCPGDVVIRCGDVGEQMYFVVKGKLDVLNSSNAVIGKMCENQYFGEIALLISTPRLVSIRAATYCLLGMIERDTFIPILEAYPEQKNRMLEAMRLYKNPNAEDSEEESADGGVPVGGRTSDGPHHEDEASSDSTSERDEPDISEIDTGFQRQRTVSIARTPATLRSKERVSASSVAADASTRRPSDLSQTSRGRRISGLFFPRVGLLGAGGGPHDKAGFGNGVPRRRSESILAAMGQGASARGAAALARRKSEIPNRQQKVTFHRSEATALMQARARADFEEMRESLRQGRVRSVSVASSSLSSDEVLEGFPLQADHGHGCLQLHAEAVAPSRNDHGCLQLPAALPPRRSVRDPSPAAPGCRVVSKPSPPGGRKSLALLGAPAQGRIVRPAGVGLPAASRVPEAAGLVGAHAEDGGRFCQLAGALLERMEDLSQQVQTMQLSIAEIRGGPVGVAGAQAEPARKLTCRGSRQRAEAD